MELTIDNQSIQAQEGERLLQAALRHGIAIPHFCYHANLPISANCRMCLVKIDGVGKLMPACNVTVADKMKVLTAVPEVQRARRMIMEFLMLNHPVDCGICDKAGECRLQDYEVAYGAPRSRSLEPKRHRRKLHELSDRIQLDNERCILCSRCVRFTAEISRSSMLGIVERGGRSFIERTGTAQEDPYSDNVIGLCPTGALLSKDFFYKSRTWYLEPVRSVCTGCSRVCSIDAWRRKKEWQFKALGAERNSMVYRITARTNPEINGPWICNKGFDQHKAMARERLLTPALRGAPCSVDEAIERARNLLSQATNPAALVSSHASNEELDAFAAAFGAPRARQLTVYVRQDCEPAPGEVIEDDLLIRGDKNPNMTGVRELFGSKSLDHEHGHDVLLIWGEWRDYARLGKAKSIHITAFAGGHERDADVCIPLSTTFERSGTFTNFEGKPNRFEKVLEKPPQVQHAQELFARLA